MSTLWLRSTRAARPCSSRSFFKSSRARTPAGTSPASSTVTSIPASVSLPSFRDQLARTADPTPAHVSFPRPRIRNQVLVRVISAAVANYLTLTAFSSLYLGHGSRSHGRQWKPTGTRRTGRHGSSRPTHSLWATLHPAPTCGRPATSNSGRYVFPFISPYLLLTVAL
jgi:hypothetical protein